MFCGSPRACVEGELAGLTGELHVWSRREAGACFDCSTDRGGLEPPLSGSADAAVAFTLPVRAEPGLVNRDFSSPPVPEGVLELVGDLRELRELHEISLLVGLDDERTEA